jgi:ATP-dependent protease Clp ATPase subunit
LVLSPFKFNYIALSIQNYNFKMSKVKILVIGPPKSGKTSITNILADLADGPTAFYKPTVALRYTINLFR